MHVLYMLNVYVCLCVQSLRPLEDVWNHWKFWKTTSHYGPAVLMIYYPFSSEANMPIVLFFDLPILVLFTSIYSETQRNVHVFVLQGTPVLINLAINQSSYHLIFRSG